ncbi:MAG: dienelactone hydrolase family protein [Microscillaceae bacterium]|jgi:carboxymethylenebutenolidase|nr:dienelactone hydrolase family protein [Microscillaceae bacterium]
MKQEIIDLYDEYTHRPLSRQEFLQRLITLVGSAAAASALLPLLESNYSQRILADDDELFSETISYPGANGTMKAYVARPKKRKSYPTVVVIHENRGLTPHIEDVTRRVARAGFLAIAPNALAPLNITPKDEDEARTLFTQLKAEDNLQNFIKVFDYLKTRRDSNHKFACVGFCWGGAMANNLAINVPQLKAAVAFYGRQPKAEEVGKIKAAIQLHYAGLDTRINEGIATYEEALKTAGIAYESYLYEGVNHAFHNDTSAARYNEAAAKLAWERTLAFFAKYLR